MLYSSVVSIIAIILAIVATILAFIYLVPEKRINGSNKFVLFLHNIVNFKSLLIEKILKALYILSTSFCIIYGFLMLFAFENSYSYFYSTSHVSWYGWVGLLLIIFGPVVIRLVYEGLMMMVLLVKNVIDIRKKLYNAPESTNDSKTPNVDM